MFEPELHEIVHLMPLNKDIDSNILYKRCELTPTEENPLFFKQSNIEAFTEKKEDAKEALTMTLKEAESKETISKRWDKFASRCKDTFQTRASDFRTSEIMVEFSKRVNDRLAEFTADNYEGDILRAMQENEEQLRSELKSRSAKLTELSGADDITGMISLVEDTCLFLTNYDSPNFYPAQFILVSEVVDHFAILMNNNILGHKSEPLGYEDAPYITREITAIEWSTRISTSQKLLPKLLMEIAFLKSVDLHPFKTKEQLIDRIGRAIGGLGCSICSIFVIDYFIKTVLINFPHYSTLFMKPLLAMYTEDLMHMERSGFEKMFRPQLNFTYQMFLDTQEPALKFFLKTLVTSCDGQTIADTIDSFYKIGKPNGFIMKVLLDVLPSRFVSIVYNVLMMMIDESDDNVPKAVLMHHMIEVLSEADVPSDTVKTTNDIWTRVRNYECDDFVYVAVPLSKYVCRFCPTKHVNLFFMHLLSVVDENYAKRGDEEGIRLSEMTVKSVKEIVKQAISRGSNFQDVFELNNSIVDLMDYLDDKSISDIALYILEDIREKPFELSDPLCVRILLEQAIIAFNSISILSPQDVVDKITSEIEWFLYRVDFGTAIDVHMSFLLQARESFQTSSRLSSVITRIAFRDCIVTYENKIDRATIILYSLFAFALSTIPSISDQEERAWLFLYGSNIALQCTFLTFAYTFVDYFMLEAPELPPTQKVLNTILHAYCLMIVLPSRPDTDNFEMFRNLIKISVRKKWPEVERKMLFAVDSVVMGSHIQRSSYVLNIKNVDSNNVLYRTDPEFIDRVRRVMDQMADRLNKSITISANKRGHVKNIANVPIVALRAIAAFADCYQFDEGLKFEFDFLFNSLPNPSMGQTQIEEVEQLRKEVERHLEKVYYGNEEALAFLDKYKIR